ncbi:hypothetical protein SNEBB_005857 [Seison nebaliae]|nr:hypothetical protein SNEBB_005857 [Seison nebaliae]
MPVQTRARKLRGSSTISNEVQSGETIKNAKPRKLRKVAPKSTKLKKSPKPKDEPNLKIEKTVEKTLENNVIFEKLDNYSNNLKDYKILPRQHNEMNRSKISTKSFDELNPEDFIILSDDETSKEKEVTSNSFKVPQDSSSIEEDSFLNETNKRHSQQDRTPFSVSMNESKYRNEIKEKLKYPCKNIGNISPFDEHNISFGSNSTTDDIKLGIIKRKLSKKTERLISVDKHEIRKLTEVKTNKPTEKQNNELLNQKEIEKESNNQIDEYLIPEVTDDVIDKCKEKRKDYLIPHHRVNDSFCIQSSDEDEIESIPQQQNQKNDSKREKEDIEPTITCSTEHGNEPNIHSLPQQRNEDEIDCFVGKYHDDVNNMEELGTNEIIENDNNSFNNQFQGDHVTSSNNHDIEMDVDNSPRKICQKKPIKNLKDAFQHKGTEFVQEVITTPKIQLTIPINHRHEGNVGNSTSESTRNESTFVKHSPKIELIPKKGILKAQVSENLVNNDNAERKFCRKSVTIKVPSKRKKKSFITSFFKATNEESESIKNDEDFCIDKSKMRKIDGKTNLDGGKNKTLIKRKRIREKIDEEFVEEKKNRPYKLQRQQMIELDTLPEAQFAGIIECVKELHGFNVCYRNLVTFIICFMPMNSRNKSVSSKKHVSTFQNFSSMNLSQIPEQIFVEPMKIVKLDLSNNTLSSIPNEFMSLLNLEELNLAKNSIKVKSANDYTTIPESFSNLKKLKILNLSENNFSLVPPVIWKCVQLTHLNLSRNKIKVVPNELSELIHVQLLNLNQTDISVLPSEIGFCDELEVIYLYDNQISSLPETICECVNLKKIYMNFERCAALIDEYMRDLLLKGQMKSDHLPSVLFELSSLTDLQLNNCQINNFPKNELVNLESLDLSENFFRTIPKTFNFPNLLQLNLMKNSIEGVSNELVNCKKLDLINLSHNHIRKTEITEKFNSIEHLTISHNELENVENILWSMENLKFLNVSDNQIKELPTSTIYQQMNKLDTLILTNNQLEDLPLHFVDLSKTLTHLHSIKFYHQYGLWILHNPLNKIPKFIWQTNDINLIYDFIRKRRICSDLVESQLNVCIWGNQINDRQTFISLIFKEYNPLKFHDYMTTIKSNILEDIDNRQDLHEECEDEICENSEIEEINEQNLHFPLTGRETLGKYLLSKNSSKTYDDLPLIEPMTNLSISSFYSELARHQNRIKIDKNLHRLNTASSKYRLRSAVTDYSAVGGENENKKNESLNKIINIIQMHHVKTYRKCSISMTELSDHYVHLEICKLFASNINDHILVFNLEEDSKNISHIRRIIFQINNKVNVSEYNQKKNSIFLCSVIKDEIDLYSIRENLEDLSNLLKDEIEIETDNETTIFLISKIYRIEDEMNSIKYFIGNVDQLIQLIELHKISNENELVTNKLIKCLRKLNVIETMNKDLISRIENDMKLYDQNFQAINYLEKLRNQNAVLMVKKDDLEFICPHLKVLNDILSKIFLVNVKEILWNKNNRIVNTDEHLSEDILLEAINELNIKGKMSRNMLKLLFLLNNPQYKVTDDQISNILQFLIVINFAYFSPLTTTIDKKLLKPFIMVPSYSKIRCHNQNDVENICKLYLENSSRLIEEKQLNGNELDNMTKEFEDYEYIDCIHSTSTIIKSFICPNRKICAFLGLMFNEMISIKLIYEI